MGLNRSCGVSRRRSIARHVTARQRNTDRKGKVVFEVKCATRRTPGGSTLTRDGKYAGTLFNVEVDWEFSAFDADGKLLARNRSRSNPAQSMRFRQNLDDPGWAPL